MKYNSDLVDYVPTMSRSYKIYQLAKVLPAGFTGRQILCIYQEFLYSSKCVIETLKDSKHNKLFRPIV